MGWNMISRDNTVFFQILIVLASISIELYSLTLRNIAPKKFAPTIFTWFYFVLAKPIHNNVQKILKNEIKKIIL